MKYTVSDIIERAGNLADISNTEFISHKENTNYVNDAFKDIYQILINKGDKQFVKEVILSGSSFGDYCEYTLPYDLYQICSINDKISGRAILRHASTESINSGTWDIVNDKLRVYGFIGSNVVMTYWVSPTFLSFPDKVLEVPDLEIISTAKNSALVNNGDGTLSVVNLVTGEVVSKFEWNNNTDYLYLGNGGFFYNNSWYNLSGEELGSSPHGVGIVYDNFWNVLSWTSDKTIESRTGSVHKDIEHDIQPRLIYEGNDIGFSGKIIYINGEAQWQMDDNVSTLMPLSCKFNNCHVFLVTTTNGWGGYNVYYALLAPHSYRIVDVDSIEMNGLEPLWITDYGVVSTDGSNLVLQSWIPDTLLNFPNEMYFSLLAADLALKYAMKQNADTGALDNLYQSYYNQFMNSLSQANAPVRIKNVYR